MNKVVILAFVILVGGVLIGVPIYGFMNPSIMPEYTKQLEAANASVDVNVVRAKYENSTWVISENINLDVGYGQKVPVVFDVEITFKPNNVLACKAHIFSDVPLPPQYEALKTTISQGWEGTWKLLKNGMFIDYKIDNPFVGISELNNVFPLAGKNFAIKDDILTYKPAALDKRELKRF